MGLSTTSILGKGEKQTLPDTSESFLSIPSVITDTLVVDSTSLPISTSSNTSDPSSTITLSTVINREPLKNGTISTADCINPHSKSQLVTTELNNKVIGSEEKEVVSERKEVASGGIGDERKVVGGGHDKEEEEEEEDLSDRAVEARHEGVLKRMRDRWALLQRMRMERKYALLGVPFNWEEG